MTARTLYSLRGALESARGTNLTPTRLLYVNTFTPLQEIGTIRPEEQRASYVPSFRAYPGIERDSLELGGDFQFDQGAFWLNLALDAVASGTGAGSDKTYAFVPNLTADDLKSATLQYGYTDGIGASKPALELGYCMIDTYRLSWRKDQPLMWSASILSPEGATQISAFTGALSDTTQVTALAKDLSIFIDTTTLGSTQDSNIVEADWEWRNHLVRFESLNGTSVGTSLDRPAARDWTLTLKRKYVNDTERDLYITKGERKVRLRNLGPALGGSTYKLDVDLYGVIDTLVQDDYQGIGTETMVVLPLYNSGASADSAVNLVNSLAAIT